MSQGLGVGKWKGNRGGGSSQQADGTGLEELVPAVDRSCGPWCLCENWWPRSTAASAGLGPAQGSLLG